jgi:hypothetical protein
MGITAVFERSIERKNRLNIEKSVYAPSKSTLIR